MTRSSRRVAPLGASVLLLSILALAGCTAVPGGVKTETPSPERSASAAPTAFPQPESVLCGGILDVWIPVARLLDQRPATELGPRAAAAVLSQDLGPNARGMAFDALPSDWFIGEESAERVVLLRPYPVPDGLTAGDPRAVGVPDFLLRLFLIDSPRPADADQWYPVFEGECTFRVPLAGLGSPDLLLDGSTRDTGSSRVDLLVLERDCNSGRSAEGRIEIVSLRESAERIEVAIGIRPSGAGVATCQGNPSTPFRIELSAPLGDREVVDVARVPARPLATGMPW